MSVVRQIVCLTERHLKMIKEVSQKMEIKLSDIVRRAIEDYHQKHVGECKDADQNRKKKG